MGEDTSGKETKPDDIEHITLALDLFEVNQWRPITPNGMGNVGVERAAEVGVAMPFTTL